MQLVNEHHSFTGMQRDTDISKHQSSFLYDAKNIRITTEGEGTLISITNEKGTSYTGNYISGDYYLGHCVVGRYLVVFSTDNDTEGEDKDDYIDRIDILQEGELIPLYKGFLNFYKSDYIEATGFYESENIQKVYWVDGRNQPRVINIIPDSNGDFPWEVDDVDREYSDYFDFVRTLKLEEEVHIIKKFNNSAMFPAGVIQYCFTYYTKYGQESNIFYTSPLLYTSFIDRGGSPEDKVPNEFFIKIENIDTKFDYVRVYSIMRTALNGTPIARRVADIEIDKDDENYVITLTDTGVIGDTIDYFSLLYKGGDIFVPSTITQKDNTLFFGNIKLPNQFDEVRTAVEDLIKRNKEAHEHAGSAVPLVINVSSEEPIEVEGTTTYVPVYRNIKFPVYPPATSADTVIKPYPYFNQLSATDLDGYSTSCGGFKRGDYYRCGIQLQDSTGRWSDPIFIKDVLVKGSPSVEYQGLADGKINLPILKGTIVSSFSTTLVNTGYKRIRAVVVFPTLLDRVVKAQGVVCPSMTTKFMANKGISAQSSWFFRPLFTGENTGDYLSPTTISSLSSGTPVTLSYLNPVAPEEHQSATGFNNFTIQEIQGIYEDDEKFKVNPNICTFHSPDVEFDKGLKLSFQNSEGHFIKVGKVKFEATLSDMEIQTETAVVSSDGSGYKPITGVHKWSRGIISSFSYNDSLVEGWKENNGERDYVFKATPAVVNWLIFPWHRTGSLNNDIDRPEGEGTRSDILKKKIISNLRVSDTYYDAYQNSVYVTGNPVNFNVFDSDQVSFTKLGEKTYQGNVDTLLTPFENSGLFYVKTEKNGTTISKYHGMTWGTYDSNNSKYVQNAWVYLNNSWNTLVPNLSTLYNMSTSKDNVRMKYKSSPHIVFNTATLTSDLFTTPEGAKSELPIVELIERGNHQSDNYREEMFGGNSPDALKANEWIPCGEPVTLVPNTDIDFYYEYGDTYFQRWDCLKTYPFTKEDINQIVEIGSFMLESRINTDGRYDRNRGQTNNLYMTPTNFNLLNEVYSQVNNFFTYKILDSDFYKNKKFPNQITWSKEKIPVSEIDAWTNINLSSTHNLDGNKGSIVELSSWMGKIYCFQENAISIIAFNSRVQIPTSDNMPIEITNNYKLDGHQYISDGVGCLSKRWVKNTPYGIYFLNSKNNHLLNLADSISDVSGTHGMSSWFENTDIITLLHDDIKGDLHILYDTGTLYYSEILGNFISFTDYDNINLIECCQDVSVTIRNKKLYTLHTGDYNYFFDNYKDWYITFISNGVDNSLMDYDKTYSTLDYRMDMFDGEDYKPDTTFSFMRLSNEYQDTGIVSVNRLLTSNIKSYHHSNTNTQKKFRIWRIQFPRSMNSRNRIRNPWAKITLGAAGNTGYKAVLHDLNLQYYV